MNGILYLAYRYLAFNRLTTATLVAVITVIIFLPFALELVLDRGSERLTARAAATPLLLGAKGSSLELVLQSLYFDGNSPEPMQYGIADSVASTGLARTIPLYLRYETGGQPIVGTNSDYFEFRKLRIDSGRSMEMLGEAVLGALAARKLNAAPGDGVLTSPETVFNVAGAYPLKLRIVGVLAPTGTPDDEGVFVDVRTAWVIGGIGHGHAEQPISSTASGPNVPVTQYREITPDNFVDFHFHGDQASFPISAILAVPEDNKAGVLLEGRYQDTDIDLQIVRPSDVMDDLLSTVLTVRQYVLAAVMLVGATTIATIVLVFVLSVRLRRGEIQTMIRIGSPPWRIGMILGSEILLVFLVSVGLAAALTAGAAAFGDDIFRAFLLSGRS